MRTVLRNDKLRNNLAVLAFFAAVVHLFYARTVHAGFVTDFTGLLERLDGAPFSGFLRCFGFPALHQVTNFFLYLFVKCFGVSGPPWYLVYSSLHIANGFLGYLLVKQIWAHAGGAAPHGPAFFTGLLFLLSPYQADAVVWKVCFNFLFCTCCLLGALLLLVKHFGTGQRRALWAGHGLFAVALFTFELAVALPLLAGVLYFVGGKSGSRPGWKPVFLPQVLLLAGYFLLNKLLIGGWVGHYGESTHLHFDLRAIASNCLKYFTKYLLYWREWPHPPKERLQLLADQPGLAYAALGLAVAVVAAGFAFFNRLSSTGRLAWAGWLLFFTALLPVSNLYVAYLLHGENDRYGYLASLFFYMGLVALLWKLPRVPRGVLLAVLLALSATGLHRITVGWQQNAALVQSLLGGFRWEAAPEVYLLASPDNLDGLPLFKDFSRKNLAVKHALRYVGGKQPVGEFFQIAQFNMASPSDGLSASVDSAGVVHLQFQQWGNWWWLHGLGLGAYETDRYRFTPDGNGCRIELTAAPADGAVFLFPVGGEWQEVYLD